MHADHAAVRVERTHRFGIRVFGTDPKSIGCFLELADPEGDGIVRIYENPDSDDNEVLMTRMELEWLRDHGIPAMLNSLARLDELPDKEKA